MFPSSPISRRDSPFTIPRTRNPASAIVPTSAAGIDPTRSATESKFFAFALSSLSPAPCGGVASSIEGMPEGVPPAGAGVSSIGGMLLIVIPLGVFTVTRTSRGLARRRLSLPLVRPALAIPLRDVPLSVGVDMALHQLVGGGRQWLDARRWGEPRRDVRGEEILLPRNDTPVRLRRPRRLLPA